MQLAFYVPLVTFQWQKVPVTFWKTRNKKKCHPKPANNQYFPQENSHSQKCCDLKEEEKKKACVP